MGFAVTASHLIFAVALLSAGSYAMGSYWRVSTDVEDAKRAAASLADEVVHTELTFTSNPLYSTANGGRITFTVQNTGSTVLLVNEFTFVVDGVFQATQASGYPKVDNNANTNLLQPGEGMECRLINLGSSPNFLRVIAGNGVSVYWAA